MSTIYHTDIAIGAPANAAIVNAPLGQLDQAIANLAGGPSASPAQLAAWTEAAAYEMTSITYSTTYLRVPTSATVKWPDGSAGTLTTDLINTTWEAIDAYRITHVSSGKTVTQAAVTRNANGSVVTKPPLTVA